MLPFATEVALATGRPLEILRLAGTEEFDPNTVTPGVVGFIFTFGLAAVVVLLVLDMVRRVRRLRYREEIAARLDAEEAGAVGPNETTGRGAEESPDGRRPGDA